jgi:hypothetical protein
MKAYGGWSILTIIKELALKDKSDKKLSLTSFSEKENNRASRL